MIFPHFSLRTKIILAFLLIIIFGGLITLYFGSRLVKTTIIQQAQSKVEHDLDAARMLFDGKLKEISDIVSLTSTRESIHEAIRTSDLGYLMRNLSRVRMEYGLDILTLTDGRGRVIIRTRNPEVSGDDQSGDEIIRRALGGEINVSPQIVSREELLKEGSDLAEKAHIRFIPTPKAADRAEEEETSGMLLKAAAAVIDSEGNILGVIYGGILVNRNYEIVDRIKELVHKEEKYKGREIGTATIFQKDLRISTNVENLNGQRAIGTRVSKEVDTAVLREGQKWIDRAFVVNAWYITAYEPIRDIEGLIIGILYVGMLEKPYLDTTSRVMLTFTLMAVLCVILLLIMLYFTTSSIINPLTKMVVATQEIARGDLSHRVAVRSKDELGYLAMSFNQMTANLRAANNKLLEWGRTLEKKVEERTTELTQMQASLIQSEKLASLGKLAAGIAHEINNPLGGILIYSHLLLEDIPKKSEHQKTLKKIVKETTRCKDIVKGLLEFARPKEPEMSPVVINDLLDRSLSIMEGQAIFQNIDIRREYTTDLPRIVADGSQLQQVFMNIILNAAEAMGDTGTLTLRTRLNKKDRTLDVQFQDTGPGIEPQNIKRLFEPFFTTKEVGKGTGLGLAISYSIVRKHGGTILVNSEPGKGSLFTVKIPIDQTKKNEQSEE
jgi:two-component system NtrC family sensor kinase